MTIVDRQFLHKPLRTKGKSEFQPTSPDNMSDFVVLTALARCCIIRAAKHQAWTTIVDRQFAGKSIKQSNYLELVHG